jgi:surfactin synthase thioesterase subunit
MVMTERSVPESAWVLRPTPRPAAPLRLFCLPSAGGGAAQYRPWAELLPPEVELCPVQLPGRENRLREEPFRQMDVLVEAVAGALHPFLDRPFALFGHSMGAVIAFELAHALRRHEDVQPVHLFVSGRRAPHLPSAEDALHHLPAFELLRALIQRYGGIPETILRDREALRLYLPILRADLALIETHTHQEREPFDCPITAFGGDRDARARREELAAWAAHTRGAFTLRMFAGGHFYLQPQRVLLVTAVVDSLMRSMVR